VTARELRRAASRELDYAERPMSARWLCALVVGLALAQLGTAPARAASPTETMEGFFDQANAILRGADRARGLDEPRQAIRTLVGEAIEVRDAAALALGAAWRSQAPEAQAEFIELFASILERGFLAAIVTKANLSGGVKIQYLGETISGDQAIVSTSLLGRNGSDVPVEYRLARRGDRWKVQDVVIEDVSLIANYRAQFNRILRDHPYTGLIARMRGEATEASPSDAEAGAQDSSPASPPPWVIGRMGDERGVPETVPVREERD